MNKRVCQRLVMAALSLALPCVAAADPIASVTGSTLPWSYTLPLQLSQSSTTNAVSVSGTYNPAYGSFSASAGGGSLPGGLYPFVSLEAYTYQPVWSYGGGSYAYATGETRSSFYVGPKPGFTSNLSPGDPIPIDFDWGNTFVFTRGTINYAWYESGPYGVYYNYNGYNQWWKPLNSSGTIQGYSAGYQQWQGVDVYALAGARTQDNVGAWARSNADSWFRPYVDPVWNAANGGGYQIYYSADKADPGPSAVPEPASLLLLGTGLGIVGLTARRRRK